MTDYVRVADFTSKDTLPSGNPAKIIKGADIDDELDIIAAAVATKVDETNGLLTTPSISGNVVYNSGTMTGSGVIDGGTY